MGNLQNSNSEPGKISSEPCSICFQQVYERETVQCFSCEHAFCQQCLATWFISQTEKLSFNPEQHFSCATPGCQFKTKPEEAIRLLSPPLQEKLEKSLLKSYLHAQDDIRNCPNPKCDYAGVMPAKGHCRRRLQCEACGTEWREETMIPPFERFLHDASECLKMELKTIVLNLYENVFSNECPNCDTVMWKSGGCQAVSCTKCNHEFCWSCKQNVLDHNQKLCKITQWTRRLCVLPIIIPVIFLIFQLCSAGAFMLFEGVNALILLVFWYNLLPVYAILLMWTWRQNPEEIVMGKLRKFYVVIFALVCVYFAREIGKSNFLYQGWVVTMIGEFILMPKTIRSRLVMFIMGN